MTFCSSCLASLAVPTLFLLLIRSSLGYTYMKNMKLEIIVWFEQYFLVIFHSHSTKSLHFRAVSDTMFCTENLSVANKNRTFISLPLFCRSCFQSKDNQYEMCHKQVHSLCVDSRPGDRLRLIFR